MKSIHTNPISDYAQQLLQGREKCLCLSISSQATRKRVGISVLKFIGFHRNKPLPQELVFKILLSPGGPKSENEQVQQHVVTEQGVEQKIWIYERSRGLCCTLLLPSEPFKAHPALAGPSISLLQVQTPREING